MHANQVAHIVSEEPRYPFPKLLALRQPSIRFTLILHNVVEHGAHASAATTSLTRASCIARASQIVVHGEGQLDTLPEKVRRKAKSAPLPAASSLLYQGQVAEWVGEHEGRIVCIGEVRENKGIERAIAASKAEAIPLSVIGAPIDREYANALVSAAQGVDVLFRLAFVDRVEFDALLLNSAGVVLPYQSLSAQSGVLARALALGVPVIACRLPSLLEQAAGSPLVTFVDRGDFEALAEAMKASQRSPADRSEVTNDAEWDLVARTASWC